MQRKQRGHYHQGLAWAVVCDQMGTGAMKECEICTRRRQKTRLMTHLIRKRRDRSTRQTLVRPQAWQIDTAFDDHAVEKAIRGPTSTIIDALSLLNPRGLMSQGVRWGPASRPPECIATLR